nr:hypothetical protein [Mycolicibacterium tusciae]
MSEPSVGDPSVWVVVEEPTGDVPVVVPVVVVPVVVVPVVVVPVVAPVFEASMFDVSVFDVSVFGESVEVDEPVCAAATPWPIAIAVPTPNATASHPTRPI